MKTCIAILTALLVATGPAFADPGKSTNYLMGKTVDWLSLGMYLLNLKVREVGQKQGVYASASYIWKQDRILLNAIQWDHATDNKDRCRELIEALRVGGFINTKLGKPYFDDGSLYSGYFTPDAYTWNDKPKTLAQEIDGLIYLKARVGEGDEAQNCEGPLVSTKILYESASAQKPPPAAEVKPSQSVSGLTLNPTQIKDIQRRLKDIGHYSGALDGARGPATRAAIRDFQTQRSIAVTGEADWDTLQAIFKQ